jgi:hypothetical protein
MEVRLSRRGAADRPEWHRTDPGSDTGPRRGAATWITFRRLKNDPGVPHRPAQLGRTTFVLEARRGVLPGTPPPPQNSAPAAIPARQPTSSPQPGPGLPHSNRFVQPGRRARRGADVWAARSAAHLREPGSGANVLAVSDLGAFAINLDVTMQIASPADSRWPPPSSGPVRRVCGAPTATRGNRCPAAT